MLRYPLVDHIHTNWGQPTTKNPVVQPYLRLFPVVVDVDMRRLIILKPHFYGDSVE